MGRIFHSERYLGSRKRNYFEGWYFRHGGDAPFSFIVGVSKNGSDEHSFIQFIDAQGSEYFRFGIDEFSYFPRDMTIMVADNVFSLCGIRARLEGERGEIAADINYGRPQLYKKTLYSPSVMGPFSYLPLNCNHAVISMRHPAEGRIYSGGEARALKAYGYIEKDYGSSFPQNYVWLHADGGETSVMTAVAWPLIGGMRGFLCLVSHKGKQYNLSLYNGAKLCRFEPAPHSVDLTIKKGGSILEISAVTGKGHALRSPVSNGQMSGEITESLDAKLNAKIILKGKEAALNEINRCALEIELGATLRFAIGQTRNGAT